MRIGSFAVGKIVEYGQCSFILPAGSSTICLGALKLLVIKGYRYQLGSVAGVGCSVGARFSSNFFCVWRRHHRWEELLFWNKEAG